jgi:hypothetical protein
LLIEIVYNLFLYVEKSRVSALGIVPHELDGTDAEKVSTLQALVQQDFITARRYPLSPKVEWNDYQSLMRLGRQLEIFEPLFKDNNAPVNPLTVVTPIVDEAPRIMAVTGLGALNLDDLCGTPLEEPGAMIDYLQKYEKDGRFDLPRLINDDYFLAIKLLYNAKHYVSAAKLVMSFIDTIAFVDAGDINDGFAKWLDTYADLASLGITSKELWEFRNSLLHMTNLSSRSVISGKTVPLIFYVGSLTRPFPASPSGAKYFSLKGLLDVIAAALSKWIESYNLVPDKWIDFVKRYDLTISDSRVAYFSIDSSSDPASKA